MTEQYSQDLKTVLELELQRNERVRAAVAAYQELAAEEKATFRLAVGIGQDAADRTREPERRSTGDVSEGNPPSRIQPIARDLMKTLLEDHPSLLAETDIENLLNRDYTQNILGLQLAGFPLLRRREAGRRGSANDGQSRYYGKLYAGRFYVCSQWWRDDHLDNARSLLRFMDGIADRNPTHPGISDLERHRKALREYIDRNGLFMLGGS